jgi:hypothetical protein
MVDTTSTSDRNSPASDLSEAGAPEIEVTPAMIEAGERAFASVASWEFEDWGLFTSALSEAYRCMDREASKSRRPA